MSESEINNIDKLISELIAKKSIAESIMDEVDSLKSIVREKMIALGMSKLDTPNHSVIYSECERTSVDKKKLQTEFPDLFGKLAKVNKYMILKIN